LFIIVAVKCQYATTKPTAVTQDSTDTIEHKASI